MLAVRVDDADTQLRVAVELAVRESELRQERVVGGVHLVGAVEADEQEVTVAVDGDAGFRHVTRLVSGMHAAAIPVAFAQGAAGSR